MSKINTNSNGYTIGFLIVMVVIVGGMLAVFSEGLRPTIEKNVELDNKSKILNSVEYAGTDILADYKTKITAIAVNNKGEIIDGVNGYDLNLKKEYKKAADDRQFPVFIYKDASTTNYILPLIGLGLWDEVNGFAAFNSDFKTLKGVAFDHVAETPGLGAVITQKWFQDLFKGKTIFNKDNDYLLKIYKAGKSPNGISDVDGLSGATLTTEGMDNMMRDCIPNYLNYFNSLKK
tara:strand:- start:29 stop:727 length:699 start_codon:yes stop_codon:yes gene_type:complete